MRTFLIRQRAHGPAVEAKITHEKKFKEQFSIELYDILGQRLIYKGANSESAVLQATSVRFGGRPEASGLFSR